MFDKLKNLFEAQKKINELKKDMENIIVDHEYENGKIKVCLNGLQRVVSININNELWQTQNKDCLETALANCINEAMEKTQQVVSQRIKTSIGDFKMPGL